MPFGPGRLLPGETEIDMKTHPITSHIATTLLALAAVALAACGSAGAPLYPAVPSEAVGSTAGPSPAAASGAPGKATLGDAASGLGTVLVNAQGRTLYLFAIDSATMSACTGDCATFWPPLATKEEPTVGAAENASLVGTITRADGSSQVTYNGHPLYTYAGDQKPGDTTGQGLVVFGGAWFALSAGGNQAHEPVVRMAGKGSNSTGPWQREPNAHITEVKASHLSMISRPSVVSRGDPRSGAQRPLTCPPGAHRGPATLAPAHAGKLQSKGSTMDDDAVAFPTLDENSLSALAAIGTRRSVAPGVYLYREGDATYDFFVVLSGVVEIVARIDLEEHLIAHHGAGHFLGELNLLTGQRVFLSARVVEPAELLVLSTESLRTVIATRPALSDTILAAFRPVARFSETTPQARFRVVGTRFFRECLELREFLVRSRIPHEWLDADRDDGVERLMRDLGVAPGDLPVAIVSGSVLRHATPGVLSSYLGLSFVGLPEEQFDLIIVGSGPAGLAAAGTAPRKDYGRCSSNGMPLAARLGSSSRIENYLGFPTGISGADLTERAVAQAEKFGARMTSRGVVTGLREQAGHLLVGLSDGISLTGRAVIAASGARYRRLQLEGLEAFEGNGVYYTATEFESRLYAGSPVVVVGGGNAAGQAALFLAEGGSSVTLAIRGPDLARTMSRYLIERIDADARIEVRTHTQVTGLDGDRTLTSLRVTDAEGEHAIASAALFSFIGADPASRLAFRTRRARPAGICAHGPGTT